jgi:2-hydroxycyclohexanecarboxyl-CoA dehydrogenase
MTQRSALVLGASRSGGVGEAVAQRLLSEGYHVVIAGRDSRHLTQMAEQLGVDALPCDVSDESSVARLADSLRARNSLLDVVVNATGEAVMGLVRKTSEADLDRAIAIHLKGPFFLCKHLPGLMRDGGSFISVSTLTAVLPIAGHGAYAAAKAGTDHLLKTVALELAARGIRVNSVTPGFMVTSMTEALTTPEVIAAFVRETPLGRLTTPRDVADAISWLAQPSAFITGQNLQINGGATLRRMPTPSEFRG